MLSPHVKVALRPSSLDSVPSAVRSAYRMSWYHPGAGFVDLPADLLQVKYATESVVLPRVISSPVTPSPDEAKVFKIAQVLRSATAPLVVIGKGSAYSRAEAPLCELIERTRLPFLPTPMGKGVVPDSHPCNTSAARSVALRHADVVLVLGARLNWILHFGQAPKWNSRARIAQVDINADVIGQNAGNDELGVVADVSVFIQRLLPQLGSWRYSENTPFRNLLAQEQDKNAKILAKAAQLETLPLTFERAYHVIRTTLDSLSPPQDGGIVYVSEGARTSE